MLLVRVILLICNRRCLLPRVECGTSLPFLRSTSIKVHMTHD
jgi:hypothetical protein